MSWCCFNASARLPHNVPKSHYLIVSASWIDVRRIEVQSKAVSGRALRRRPVVAVGALNVKAGIPVATALGEPDVCTA